MVKVNWRSGHDQQLSQQMTWCANEALRWHRCGVGRRGRARA